MIEIPTTRPATIAAIEKDFGTTIATSIWLKVINNHTWVERNLPIGFCIQFDRSINVAAGSPLPDPNTDIWIFCDGTLINDAESPLNGQNVPDFRNQFLKHDDGAQFVTGGALNTDLSHTHTIGITDNREPFNDADNNDDRVSGFPHNHGLDSDLGVIGLLPLHIQYHIFMRFK